MSALQLVAVLIAPEAPGQLAGQSHAIQRGSGYSKTGRKAESDDGEVETMTATVRCALRASISQAIIPAPAISTH